MSETDKPAAPSAAERKRRERKEKRADGLVPFEAWTYPEVKDEAKAAVADITKKAGRARAAAAKKAAKKP